MFLNQSGLDLKKSLKNKKETAILIYLAVLLLDFIPEILNEKSTHSRHRGESNEHALLTSKISAEGL